MTQATTVLFDQLSFPEDPRWHDGRLWFSDMAACRVMTVDLNGTPETVVDVPGRPSGLGWLPDGPLLVVSMTDRRLLRFDRKEVALVADLSHLGPSYCNDMVVDAHGRAYVGHFGSDLLTEGTRAGGYIVLVTPDGQARVVADQMAFPNGSVITPDGRTLIVGESGTARLTAFDIQRDGSLGRRRIWAALQGASPDGICLDAEGAVWVASPISAEVIRVCEGGEVTDRLPVATQAFACMLGGPDRRTLFILTAITFEHEQAAAQRAGRIQTVRVEVPGAGWP